MRQLLAPRGRPARGALLSGSLAGLIGLGLPLSAAAHGFGRLYTLPVPLWLYAWGAASALLLSFALIAAWALAPAGQAEGGAGRDIHDSALIRHLRRTLPLLRGLALAALLLCIASALFGNRDPYRNFSMTSFWIVFVLGLPYLTVLGGNLYALINPWQSLAEALGRCWAGYLQGRIRYPAGWGDWPALGLYLGFIWYELFAAGKPASLGAMLLAYSLINLIGVGLIGAAAWFRHGELFAVLLRLLGHMAPLGPGPDGRLHLRPPLRGLILARPASLGSVAFAMAMLSTTAFDGLRATQWWVSLFWADPSGLVTALAGSRPMLAIGQLRPWYIAWESLWLLLGPFLYLGAYGLCLVLARWITGSRRPLRELVLDFGYSLLPIALVYHLSHYATLLLSDGLKILSLLSDPFGFGWNLFGTAWKFRAPILLDMNVIWHAQVLLILLGHIASVWVAHRIALRVFDSRRAAWLSQLPMLLLMVGMTVAGLWILAQPLTVERMN